MAQNPKDYEVGATLLCEACGKHFPCANTKADAMAEAESIFGRVPEDDQMIVCDACFTALRPLMPDGGPS